MRPVLILMEMLSVLMGPSLVLGTERRLKAPAAHFLHQRKHECYYANGTSGDMRFLDRFFYDRQEYVRFDSHLGVFEAITPLGELAARSWNSQKEYLDAMGAEVKRFCRYNYWVSEPFLVTRKVQPTVKISHTKAGPLAHHSLLICTAAGYYPSEVNFKWLKNGQEQTKQAGYAEEVQNGDWTFQNQAMLETVPARGDIYTCQVEHSSLKEPVMVQWAPQMSESSKSKMWTGGMGALLGVVFGAVALYLYLKNRKVVDCPESLGDGGMEAQINK